MTLGWRRLGGVKGGRLWRCGVAARTVEWRAMSGSLFPQQVIARKRDGHALTRDEIAAFVRGATDGSLADCQLSAMLMAIFFRGMTPQETAQLTEAMMRSGVVADLAGVKRPKADKHSTGGVGDKVSLHLAPLVAACGVAVPLICASILSKKLAEGTQVLVGDVKFGRGAFMKDKADARRLAQALVSVANAMGTPMRAVLTAMDEPLGRAVGNALEVAESIDCLKGRGPADTMEVTYALGEQMLLLAKVATAKEGAREKLEASIASGAALQKFRELVTAQGGDARVADEPSRLPQAKFKVPLTALRAGFVQDVDALGVAFAALRLGAGRTKAEDKIDHAVGVSALAKIGERVEKGAPLCVMHANDEPALAEARAMLAKAIVVGDGAK